MNEKNIKSSGFVYILDVKDIVLPVCKIGMTSRNPYDRCSEINNSSTGDFIWEVAHQIAVDNCQKLESMIHKKLEPLRQKKREFFNINAEDAYKAILSIIESQSEVKMIDEKIILKSINPKANKIITKTKRTFSRADSEYSELLQLFTELLHIKGKPFGQLNKPVFGMSDGKEGVQWNIAVSTEVRNIQVGVNLEGKVYSNWPIATFILSELKNPTISELKTKLKQPEKIFIRFTRDAWQATSRPDIVEKYFGGREFPLLEIHSELWTSILKEALDCLNEKKMYRGRNKQIVTLAKKPRNGVQSRTMEVSPHLTIWTPIDLSEDIATNLNIGISRLEPVHNWLSKVSQ
jgi:Meiotically up-regulated gene 113